MKTTIATILAAAMLLLVAPSAQSQVVSRSKAKNLTALKVDKSQMTTRKGEAVKKVKKASMPTSVSEAELSRAYQINGNISHDRWNAYESATIIFQRFPANIDEFRQVQQLLGKEPQGVVALQVMAFELYRRDAEMGKAALELVNTPTNYTSTVRQLAEIMGKDKYYARPYIATALLQGATPENAYTPTEPYTVKVRVNPNTKYQESQMLGGTVISLQIDSQGWDTPWRTVDVVKPKGSDYYVVSNCPAMYTQCKETKGMWAEPK